MTLDRNDRWTLLACVALLGPLFYAAIPELSTGLLGYESVDHYGTQWFYWFALHHLQAGQSADHSDLFFYPWGKDIYGHTGANLLDAYLAIPFRLLVGPTLGYNLFVLFGIAVSGAAFYRFCGLFSEDRLSRLVATFCFAFSPYVLYELLEGRPTQAILLFPVLFFHALWRSGRERGLLQPTLAGVWLALAGYQYWYYAFFGGLMAFTHGMYLASQRPREESWRILGRHGLTAAVSLILCLPGALPLLLASMKSGEVPGLLNTDLWSLSDTPPTTVEGNTVGLFLLQPISAAAGYYVRDLGGKERFLPTLYPVPLLMLPALYSWWRNPGRLSRGPVLALVGTAVLIGIGPMLIVWKYVATNPIYLILAKGISFMRRLWWPGRAVGMALIPVFPALAVALERSSWRRPLAFAACAELLYALWVGRLAPLPTWDAGIPAGYQCLKSGPEGAIIELPFAWNQAHLYYQTQHQRPLFGGMIEDNEVFAPPEMTALRKKNTYLLRILELTKLSSSKVEPTEADRQALRDLGYRYVVVQKDAYVPAPDAPAGEKAITTSRLRKLNHDLSDMMGRPVYSDARINIYAPWGDPVPCDVATNGVDKTSRWIPNTDPVARLGIRPELYIVQHLFGTVTTSEDSDSDSTEDQGTDPAATDPTGATQEPPAEEQAVEPTGKAAAPTEAGKASGATAPTPPAP